MFQRIRFNWKAQTAHGLHSPFVFQLYTEVIDPIYQQSPEKLQEALIHGIGSYLKLSAGHMHVIDLVSIQDSDLATIEQLFLDKHTIIICLNPQANKQTTDRWRKLYQNKAVIHSIELFELGILCLNPIAPKQHFWLKKS
jgi:hypothetical protein